MRGKKIKSQETLAYMRERTNVKYKRESVHNYKAKRAANDVANERNVEKKINK